MKKFSCVLVGLDALRGFQILVSFRFDFGRYVSRMNAFDVAAITMIRDFITKVPVTHYYSWTLPPGLPPRWAQSHLELFASKVIPRVSLTRDGRAEIQARAVDSSRLRLHAS